MKEKDLEKEGFVCKEILPFNDKKPLKDIERSLIKTYRKHVWAKFIKAIKEYELVQDGDKIAIAISGGKDSLILAKLFQELHKYGNRNFVSHRRQLAKNNSV